MKAYPSIQYWNKGTFGEKVYCFSKIDGSQLRVEWSKKRGFFKFGTRGQMIDETHDQWGEAVKIFLETYSDSLPAIFRKKYREVENFVCFAEYYGYNSFAGNHELLDKKHVALFDVSAYKRGILPPKEFVDNFQLPETVSFLGVRTYGRELIETVKRSKWTPFKIESDRPQLTFEGIVCKWIQKTKGQDLVKMTKIKSSDWLRKVKLQYGEDFLIKELNNDRTLFNETGV